MHHLPVLGSGHERMRRPSGPGLPKDHLCLGDKQVELLVKVEPDDALDHRPLFYEDVEPPQGLRRFGLSEREILFGERKKIGIV
jgi:hypothetical protein